MADIAADVNGEITTDGAGGGGQGVGGTEDDTAGLDDVTALPDHGGDGARAHVFIVLGYVERRGRCHVQAIRPGKKGLSDRSA